MIRGMYRHFFVVALFLGMGLAAQPSAAQPIATFRWQLSPFCNTVSFAVTQSFTVFRLDGTDDQCGASTKAAAAGVAFVNPDGSIGLGFTIVGAPGGAPVHVDATVTLPALNGTWRDSSGNSGSFVATPGAGTGGPPRPLGGGATHETIVSAFEALASGTTSLDIGGCFVLGPGGPGDLLLGLTLPRGAVITEVRVKLSDTSGDAAVSAVLVGDDYPDGGPPGLAVVSQVLTSPDGAHSNIALVLLPSAAVPASRTRSYHIAIGAPSHVGGLQFCGASVRYTLDPAAAADGAESVRQ